MTTIAGFPFFELHFENDGKPSQAAELAALTQQVTTAAGTTDVILIAHGFRNDEQDATTLYTNFLTTLRAHLAEPAFQSIANRQYAVGAVFWKSKQFDESPGNDGKAQGIDSETLARDAVVATLNDIRDSIASSEQRPKLDAAIGLVDQLKGSPETQNKFVSLVMSLTDGIPADPTEGLEQIRAKDGSELLRVLQAPIILPTTRASDSDGGAAGFAGVGVGMGGDGDGGAQSFGSFVGGILGPVNSFLNLTTWYVMKNRGGVVGANGVADAVRALKALNPAPRVHLVGHSLGGRLMAACAKALATAPVAHPDSLTLLEAAFSHYGFSAKGANNPEGFFRPVVTSSVVTGPTIATFSAHDTVVGLAYAISSRLAGDNTKAVGDKDDQYGGIGRNGAQFCDVGVETMLHIAGTPYDKFAIGKIVSLDGSDGLITNHSDVTNPNVTYAFASALAET